MNETKSYERNPESVETKAERGMELFNALESAGNKKITTKEALKTDGALYDEFVNGLLLYIERVVRGGSDISGLVRELVKISKSRYLGIDKEDICQDLALFVLEKADHFLLLREAGREMAYIHTIVKNKLLRLKDNIKNPLIDFGEVDSLDRELGKGEATEYDFLRDKNVDVEGEVQRKLTAKECINRMVDDLYKYTDDLLMVIGVGYLQEKPRMLAEELYDVGSVEALLEIYEIMISDILNDDSICFLTNRTGASKRLNQAIRMPGSNPETIVGVIYDILKHKRVKKYTNREEVQ